MAESGIRRLDRWLPYWMRNRGLSSRKSNGNGVVRPECGELVELDSVLGYRVGCAYGGRDMATGLVCLCVSAKASSYVLLTGT
jgi:hypothetical protein